MGITVVIISGKNKKKMFMLQYNVKLLTKTFPTCMCTYLDRYTRYTKSQRSMFCFFLQNLHLPRKRIPGKVSKDWIYGYKIKNKSEKKNIQGFEMIF